MENIMSKLQMNKKQKINFVLSILVALIVFFLPIGLNQKQKLIMSGTVLVIYWWAAEVVDKVFSSVFLLSFYLIFSGAPIKLVFKFPFLSAFYLVLCTFLLSQGMVNSKLAKRASLKLLNKYGSSPLKLIILSFLINYVLVLLIPQAFPRVIVLSTLYLEYLKYTEIDEKSKAAILMSIFVATTSTSMIFINGDMLLNVISLKLGGVSLEWLEWALYMVVPSILTTIVLIIAFLVVFRKEMSITKTINKPNVELDEMSVVEKQTLGIITVILLLFMTQSIHHIDLAWIAFGGVVAMVVLKILPLQDLKKVNMPLMTFMTAAFSIGAVLSYVGVGNYIASKVVTILPENKLLFIFYFIAILMIAHMIFGSVITTLSIILPTFINMNLTIVDPIILTLIAFTVGSIHYILPHHHVTVMVGYGKKYYPMSYVIRYGLLLTILTFLVVFCIEIPWWILIGKF
jgi:di/tricarboxylate transporter